MYICIVCIVSIQKTRTLIKKGNPPFKGTNNSIRGKRDVTGRWEPFYLSPQWIKLYGEQGSSRHVGSLLCPGFAEALDFGLFHPFPFPGNGKYTWEKQLFRYMMFIDV